MMENTNTIIIFLACIIGILLLGKAFVIPVKMIIRLIINSILGVALIYIINLIGTSFEFHIGLNVFTSIFVRNTWNSRSNIINIF